MRLALVIGGISFDDERILYEEIARRREASLLPFSHVPVMEVDGHVFA